MKASLKLLVLFFAVCIFGTLIAATLIMLGLDLRVLVAGSSLVPFSLPFLWRGVLLSLPFMSVAALLSVVLYLIRHPAQNIFPILTYILLGLVTWGVLIPGSIGLYGYYDRTTFGWMQQPHSEDLTPNYFRIYDGNIYYYSRLFRYNEAARDMYGEGLMIDLMGIRGKEGMMYPFSTSVVIRDSENQYSDVIFKEAAKMPPVVAAPVSAYMTLFDTGIRSILSGLFAWIAYASMGLAMLAAAWLTTLSSWRFLKAFIVVVAGIAVALLNYAVYAHRLLQGLATLCERFFVDVGLAAPQTFSGIVHIIEPLALFINLICILLFFLLGLVGKQLLKRSTYVTGDDE